MNVIWANRLVAGTRKWAEVPASRKAGVKAELASRVENGKISAEQYEKITGERFVRDEAPDVLARIESNVRNMLARLH